MLETKKYDKKNVKEMVGEIWHSPLRLYSQAAVQQGCTVEYYPGLVMARMTCPKKEFFIKDAATPLNNHTAATIASHKYVTNILLAEAGLPVSKGALVKKKEFVGDEWDIGDLPFPLLAKPAHSSFGGAGIHSNIQSMDDLKKALTESFKKYTAMLVEEFHQNLIDYRILVLDGEVLSSVKRTPATIYGDGSSTVQALVDAKTEERKRLKTLSYPVVKIDDEVLRSLQEMNLSLDAVPEKGQRVQLREQCNLNLGGETENVDDQICEENKQIAIRAAEVLGLRLAGMDFLCEDISVPMTESRGVIVEANQHPGITLNALPTIGEGTDVATPIIKTIIETG